jgi:hypothetical protein
LGRSLGNREIASLWVTHSWRRTERMWVRPHGRLPISPWIWRALAPSWLSIPGSWRSPVPGCTLPPCSDLSCEEAVRLDLRYVESWSLAHDALSSERQLEWSFGHRRLLNRLMLISSVVPRTARRGRYDEPVFRKSRFATQQ